MSDEVIFCVEKAAFIFCAEDRAYSVFTQQAANLRTISSFLLLKEQLEFGEFEWLTDMDMFAEHFGQETLAAAEVPQLPVSHQNFATSYRINKSNMRLKKQRIERAEDVDKYFIVPDLC
ncbi:hypothetical protein QQ045_009554 [Rhodiola kirilowii]